MRIRCLSIRILVPATVTGLALLAMTAPAGALVLGCSATASNPINGQILNISGASPCDISANNPDPSVSALSSARAVVSPGLLRAEAVTGTSGTTSFTFHMGAAALATLQDTMTVAGLPGTGALLTFNVRVTGSLESSRIRSGTSQPTAATDFVFNYSLGNFDFFTPGTNGILNGCAHNADAGISTCNGSFSFPVGGSVLVDDLVSLSVFAHNGDHLGLGLSLSASGLSRIEQDGDSAATSADFAHTVQWLGLAFSEASANAVVTGESGFDYGQRIQQDVPEPATLAFLGLSLAGLRVMRRRRTA